MHYHRVKKVKGFRLMPKPSIRITTDGIAGGPTPTEPKPKPSEDDSSNRPIPPKIPEDDDPIRDQIIKEIQEERKDLIGDHEIPDYNSMGTEELKLLLDTIRKKKKQQEAKDEGSSNKERIKLDDGSVFEKVTTTFKWYDSYYYVVYDLIHEPKLMNWWTCIDEYTTSYIHYSYISGPTHSIPDEAKTDKTNEWRYDFNSVPLNKTVVVWNQGRHDLGNNSGGFVVPVDDVQDEEDPIDSQFEALFEDWQDKKSKPKVGTPVSSGSSSNGTSGVKVGDKVLPASFFTKPHTLKELIELHLVDSKGFTQGLLNNLTNAEILFYLEYFPYSEK